MWPTPFHLSGASAPAAAAWLLSGSAGDARLGSRDAVRRTGTLVGDRGDCGADATRVGARRRARPGWRSYGRSARRPGWVADVATHCQPSELLECGRHAPCSVWRAYPLRNPGSATARGVRLRSSHGTPPRSLLRPALRGKGAPALAEGVFDVIGAARCPRSAQDRTLLPEAQMLTTGPKRDLRKRAG